MACAHRILLDCCRETYGLGSNPSSPAFNYAADSVVQNANPQTEVFENTTIDLATFRRISLPANRTVAVLAFRGTQPPQITANWSLFDSIKDDWLNNTKIKPIDAPGTVGGATVHSGFAHSLQSLLNTPNQNRTTLQAAINVARDAGDQLVITGHSKGGAMAHIAAWTLHQAQAWPADRISVVSFAAARSGNSIYAENYTRIFAERAIRYEVIGDVVPNVPIGPGQSPLSQLCSQILGNFGHSEWQYYGVGVPIYGDFPALSWLWQEGKSMFFGLADALTPGQTDYKKTHFLPLLARAHAIDAGSSYDLLTCPDGTAGRACKHRV